MNLENREIKDNILMAALKDVPFDGWTWPVIEKAGEKAGYNTDMALAVFPAKIPDVLNHLSLWADARMLEHLKTLNTAEMRMRDKIRIAVEERIKALEPHKEAVKASSAYWLKTIRKIEAGKIVWRTADTIWNWAGDDSKDYNRYSKRLILSGVITATMLAWFKDTSDKSLNTMDFLSRRIDNALAIGKITGKIIGKKKAG